VSFRYALITPLAVAGFMAPVADARVDPPLASQDLRSPDTRDAALGRDVTASPTIVPVKVPVRATPHQSGSDFPWLEAALVATLVGGAAGAARWRLHTATPA
jgi:hypothetical protein